MSRCTIVFTHCSEKDISFEKFIQANKQHEQFVNIIKTVKNVIFGDTETENKYIKSPAAPPQIIEIVNHTPRVCIRKCGHIFHYQCLKKVFDRKKRMSDGRTNLRNLPERIFALVAGR